MKLNRDINHPYLPTDDAEVIAEGRVVVDMIEYEGRDLEATTESIGVIVDGLIVFALTWAEARDLSRALRRVEEIARVG
jgi:hypothetical protein